MNDFIDFKEKAKDFRTVNKIIDKYGTKITFLPKIKKLNTVSAKLLDIIIYEYTQKGVDAENILKFSLSEYMQLRNISNKNML